jgi:nucleotidyltransferase substrate binding protein (TIGR01987 family)
MADRSTGLENVERALAELEEYAALPIANRRDKAGLIQGFEFTFELFWKLFMKLAPDAGIEARSPREALIAGAQLRLIDEAEQTHWTRMLLDRNQTSHTYNADLADEIIGRVVGIYLDCFRATMARTRAATSARLVPQPG